MMEATEEEDMRIVRNYSALEGNLWIRLSFMMRFSSDLNLPSSFYQHVIHLFVRLFGQPAHIYGLLVTGTWDAAVNERKTPFLMGLTS